MTASLLALSTGHYSLEFEPSDMPSVKATILDQFGRPEIQQYGFSAEYRFGGSSFTFQGEWDEPCFISDSDSGDDILRTIYQVLSAER
ncbi:hypothetical protein [Sphingobium sp. EP60837]|uniref:hypothetical protein n=1 Tax=Sphingobium sp. EP60837 TaxID=1855519 RepID=UPI0012E76371|nr:hypothetical protein [Sphingobium sp. EP60837]